MKYTTLWIKPKRTVLPSIIQTKIVIDETKQLS